MSLEDQSPFTPHPGPAAPPAPEPPPRQPYVCWAIIALSAGFYLYDALRLGTLQEPGHVGLLHGPDVLSGEWWRLFTSTFEHGGFVHLALNMSVVVTLGFRFERAAGHDVVALCSVVTALGGCALALLLSYDGYTLGASGMIVGWAGAMLPIATKAWRTTLATWVVQVAILSTWPHVSWQGHLGGFLFGLLCGFALRLGRKPFWVIGPLLGALSFGAAVGAARLGARYFAESLSSASPSADAIRSLTASVPSGMTGEPSGNAAGKLTLNPTQNSSKHG